MNPNAQLKPLGLQISCPLCGQTHSISQGSLSFYQCGGHHHFVGIDGKSFIEEPNRPSQQKSF